MKRLKKVLKWTGIGLAILVALKLAVTACFVWTAGRRLHRQVAAIRAAGDPVSIAELARQPIPPERNAYTYLHSVSAEARAFEEDLGSADQSRDYDVIPTYPIPEKVRQALTAVFKAHPKVVPILQQAAACPDYEPPPDYASGLKQSTEESRSVVREFRDCARTLVYWSRLKVAEGKGDEAVRSALLILPLVNHLDRNPFVTDHLVALTVRGMAVHAANYALQTGPISKEVRASLDAELASCEGSDTWSRALRNDRVFVLEADWREWPGRDVWLVGRPLWNWRTADVLEAYAAVAPLLESDRDYRDEAQRVEKTMSSLGSFGREVFVPLSNCRIPSLWTRSQIRCLRVVNALQTHVPKGSSQVPKLGELGLPAATTTDPFDGEPLRVKRLPEGWLVYSVSLDLTDDGGTVPGCAHHAHDIGVGPPPRSKSQ